MFGSVLLVAVFLPHALAEDAVPNPSLLELELKGPRRNEDPCAL